MARSKGQISSVRHQGRESLATVLQSLPSLLQGFVLGADPDFRWPEFGLVYQYTQFQTLRALLGGDTFRVPPEHPVLQSIWATSSLYLNDREEFKRGQAVLGTAIDGLPKGKVKTQMQLALRDADALEVYVACFSAVDDDLSQWRGYGDNGSGVCLGYDLQALRQELTGIGYWVTYGKQGNEALQLKTAKGLVSYLHGAISAALPPGNVPDAVHQEVRQQLTEIWPAVCLGFKHSDFSAEREFRIVYSKAVGKTIQHSFRGPTMVPFAKLRMTTGGKLPLKTVRLGPAVSSEANLRSTRLALSRSYLDSIEVCASDIPYVPK